MSEIDNRLLYQIFKEGNFQKLYNITTYDKLLRMTLKDPETGEVLSDSEVSIDKLSQIAEVIQTCTRNAEFTHDILRKYGYIEGLGKYIRVVHAGKTENSSDRSITYTESSFPKTLSETEDSSLTVNPDNIKINAPASSLNDFQKALYKKSNSGGKIGYAISKDDILSTGSNYLIRNKFSESYNIAWLVNDSLPEILGVDDKPSRNAREEQPSNSTKLTEVFNCNKTYAGKTITEANTLKDLNVAGVLPKKDSTSLSSIQVLTPGIRLSNRQTAELSTFMSLVNSTEMSKCLPYLSAEFVLPRQFEQSGRKFRTATMTNFLFDSFEQPTDSTISENFYAFERNDVVTTSYRGNKILGTRSPMAPFLMPQTLVNANEKVIGHPSNRRGEETAINSRLTPVQDPFKPFMTIDSLTVEVVPQRELMSFKTAKMSITLHDKSRMGDIAPFIKPDLFGVFGGEIAIEYGWSHPDNEVYLSDTPNAIQNKLYNPVGKFLNAFRNKEKYAIINSTFNIQENGQVKIELSLAMKGAIEIRGKKLFFSKTLEQLGKELEALRQQIYSINPNMEVEKVGEGNLPNLGKAAAPINKIVETNPNIGSFINGLIINSENITKEQMAVVKAFTSSSLRSALNQSVTNENISTHVIQAFSVELTDVGKANLLRRNILKLIAILRKINKINSTRNAIRKEKEKGIMSYSRNWFDPYLDSDYLKNLTYFQNHYEIKNDVTNRVSGRASPPGSSGNNHKRKRYPARKKSIFNSKDLSSPNYSSFGSFLISFIGSPLLHSQRFDEIQFIFYNLNSYASESHDANIASLPIDNKKMREFVKGFLQKVSRISLESFLQQVINKFIEGKASPLYGMHNIFESASDSAGDRPKKAYQKQNVRDKEIDSILKKAYGIEEDDKGIVEFRPPKIGLSFDTLMPRSNRGGIDKTILKVSIYDKNDHPFGTMFEHFDQDVGGQIIKLSRRYSDAKYKRKNNVLNKKQFIKLTQGIGQEAAKYFTDNGDGTLTFNGINGSAIKEFYQKFMPTAHFGTQNTALLKATASTVNDARINTAFMTQADRNVDVKSNVSVDVPLNILPNHVDLEMIGCPIIDFGQMMFLDFITGTSVDNIYNVTGITHNISQGQFTTRVKVTYGDIYGKYVAAAGNLAGIINSPAAATRSTERASSEESVKEINSIKTTAKFRKITNTIDAALDYETSDYQENQLIFDFSSIRDVQRENILKLNEIPVHRETNTFYDTDLFRKLYSLSTFNDSNHSEPTEKTLNQQEINVYYNIVLTNLNNEDLYAYTITLKISANSLIFKKSGSSSRTIFEINLFKSFEINCIQNFDTNVIREKLDDNQTFLKIERIKNNTGEKRKVLQNIMREINFQNINKKDLQNINSALLDISLVNERSVFVNYSVWKQSPSSSELQYFNLLKKYLILKDARFLSSLVKIEKKS